MKHISETNIDIFKEYEQAKHASAGAIVMFSGDVRDLNKGKKVLHIDYEAYVPLAEKSIAQILVDAKQKWNLQNAICIHRIGIVNISETAVVVLTASAHRKEAYDANRYIIDRVKHEAPLWKHEFFADGTDEYGSNCECGDPNHKH